MVRPAMSVPVLREKKWRRLDSKLRVRYGMAAPSGSPQLGTSKRSSAHFFFYAFKPLSIQSSDERIEASQSSSPQRGGHFWHLGSVASLGTETTVGLILVAFWPKHGLRSDLRVPNFPGGACPHTPYSLFTPQWPYQSKIPGSGPVQALSLLQLYPIISNLHRSTEISDKCMKSTCIQLESTFATFLYRIHKHTFPTTLRVST